MYRLTSLFLVSAIVVLLTSPLQASGLCISVEPFQRFQGGFVGLHAGPIEFGAGIDLGRLSTTMNIDASHTSPYDSYDYSLETGLTGVLLMPSVSAKAMLGSGDVRPYLRFVAGPLLIKSLTVSAEVNDQYAQDEIDEIIEQINEQLAEALDSFSMVVARAALGGDYSITPNVSVFGEYGVRLVWSRFWYELEEANESYSYDPYDPYGSVSQTRSVIETQLSSLLNATYSSLGISYRF